MRDLVEAAQRGIEADVLPVGEVGDEALGAIADGAFGHVEDAAQVDVVIGVGDHAQVGEGVLDLLALVEAGAADDLVRDSGADECVFDRS